MSQIKIYTDRKKELRWTLIGRNGKKLANSGEGYKNKKDLLKIVAMLFPWYRVQTKALKAAVKQATQETYDNLI